MGGLRPREVLGASTRGPRALAVAGEPQGGLAVSCVVWELGAITGVLGTSHSAGLGLGPGEPSAGLGSA